MPLGHRSVRRALLLDDLDDRNRSVAPALCIDHLLFLDHLGVDRCPRIEGQVAILIDGHEGVVRAEGVKRILPDKPRGKDGRIGRDRVGENKDGLRLLDQDPV